MNRTEGCRAVCVLALLVSGAAGMAPAQEAKIPEITIPVCKTAPRIDGQPDDAAWKHAYAVKQFYFLPHDGAG